jgi:predicted aspartyl protease
MRRLIVLILLASAMPATAFADPVSPPPACHLMQIASLDMTTEPSGLVSVPAAVNGHAIRMMVDTGDIASNIASDTVNMLGLHTKQAPFYTVFPGNVRSHDYAVVDKFELQRLAIPNLEMMVMPSQALPSGIQGILGPSVLKNMDVEFDFAHSKFNLFSPDHCPHNVVYWTKDAYAEIPITVDHLFKIDIDVKLDGQTLHAAIDSGAEHSVMGMETAHSFFGLDASSSGMKSRGKIPVNGQRAVNIYRHPFAAMSFGGVQVNNPVIDILPDEVFNKHQPDLLIGINILRQMHFYISYNEKRLYVTPAGAH